MGHNWHTRKLLFMFKTTSACGLNFVNYCYFTSGNMDAGIVKFRANCIACVEIERDSEDKFVLEYARVDRIATTYKVDCAARVDVGMFQHYALDEWADELVPDSDADITVDMRQLCFSEVAGDRFQVHAVMADASDLTVAIGGEPPEEATASDNDWGDGVVPKPASIPARRQHRPPRDSTMGPRLYEAIGDAVGVPAAVLAMDDDCSGEDADSQDSLSAGVGSDEGEEPDASSARVLEHVAATPDNCIDVLYTLGSADEVTEQMPRFTMNASWQVVDTSTTQVLARIRCVHGSYLRIDCAAHRTCKMHLDIYSDFQRLNAVMMLWAISAVASDAAVPDERRVSLPRRWRSDHWR